MTYTYTIFDNDPNASDGNPWPAHEDLEIEADSDDEAIEEVRDVMRSEAAGLNPSDGYSAGDLIHALVWDAEGMIVGTPTYELTHDDLGTEAESREERLERAAKSVSATQLDDETWVYYADETSRWYRVSSDEMAELCDYLDHDDPAIARDAYSHWCAGTSAEEMPRGWEPDDASTYALIEYMPEWLRASHDAAGNSGVYPHNGAERVYVRGDVDASLLDSRWARLIKEGIAASDVPDDEPRLDSIPDEALDTER